MVGFNMSVRPIIAATEGAAWDKAKHILSGMTGALGWSRQEREGVRAPVDNAGRRQFALAQEKDVHDERLWMGITKRPARWAIRHAWWALPNKSLIRLLAIIVSALRRS